MVTWIDWVQDLAIEHGLPIPSPAEVETLLWERTAWPVAGRDETRRQLDIEFERLRVGGPLPCPCCGGEMAADDAFGVCRGCRDNHGWAEPDESESRMIRIDLSSDDLDLLTACLGNDWVDGLLDETTRSAAIVELCRTLGRTTGRDARLGVFPSSVDSADWTRPPGRLLQTWADAHGLAPEDVATACDLPLDVYHGIVAGTEHITDPVARNLERGTDLFPKNIWLKLDRNYRAALVEHAGTATPTSPGQ